ncbi:MAG TPA: hypothetical protein VFE33_22870 [Thermoanaerobaculia bacterium]|nr:hypothetical protein [Thermoanaerobaculia bacterium]
MLSVSLRRTLAVLVLAALVCLPSASFAAPSGPARHVQAEEGVFARLWSLLQSLWGEEGMTIDPNGSHAVATPGRTSMTHLSGAEGVLIDPNGSH